MKLFISAIALIAMTGAASADLNLTSNSQSGAIANVTNNYIQEGNQAPQNVFEGSDVPNNTPSVSAPGSMHTAPCIVGRSVGFSIPGFGISGSGGRVENNCNSREETSFLAQLLSMPHGPARTAAIYHACATDASMRATLVGMGICRPQTPAVDSSRGTPSNRDVAPEPARVALEVQCERNDAGQIVPRVTQRVMDAYSTAEIMDACR